MVSTLQTHLPCMCIVPVLPKSGYIPFQLSVEGIAGTISTHSSTFTACKKLTDNRAALLERIVDNVSKNHSNIHIVSIGLRNCLYASHMI